VLKQFHTVRRVTRCEPKHQLTLRARICTVLRHIEFSFLGGSCNSTDPLSGSNRSEVLLVLPIEHEDLPCYRELVCRHGRTLTRPMSPSSRCAVSSVKMASSGACGKKTGNLWRSMATAYRIHLRNVHDRACSCQLIGLGCCM
jgi:hypothetical protein